MPELTTRQAEIRDLLNEGLDARTIAERLDITRNAVYQQINALKKKGALPNDYTPSGEVRVPPQDGLVHLPPMVPAGSSTSSSAHIQIISQLVDMNRVLIDTVARLTDELAAAKKG